MHLDLLPSGEVLVGLPTHAPRATFLLCIQCSGQDTPVLCGVLRMIPSAQHVSGCAQFAAGACVELSTLLSYWEGVPAADGLEQEPAYPLYYSAVRWPFFRLYTCLQHKAAVVCYCAYLPQRLVAQRVVG
jgi:hypothetical protein